METTYKDLTIELTASAQEALREAQTMVNKAHAWAVGYQLDADATAAGARERMDLVREMETSLLKNLVFLFTMNMGTGPIKVWRDGEGCFYWREQSTGYEGGLIFHRNHKWPEESGLGTWSIHT